MVVEGTCCMLASLSQGGREIAYFDGASLIRSAHICIFIGLLGVHINPFHSLATTMVVLFSSDCRFCYQIEQQLANLKLFSLRIFLYNKFKKFENNDCKGMHREFILFLKTAHNILMMHDDDEKHFTRES